MLLNIVAAEDITVSSKKISNVIAVINNSAISEETKTFFAFGHEILSNSESIFFIIMLTATTCELYSREEPSLLSII